MSSPPSELGVWTVGKLLGEGAFSKVYAATIRPDMMDHPTTANLRSSQWVLKISPVPVKKGKAKPKGKLADALLAARLLHWEYTVYSSFLAKHPHVPARPFGRAGFGDQEGWRFLAMARMGKTLRQHVDDAGGALDGPEALGLGIRVLDSLSLLHAKGVLFRDVKPENFMFDVDGELCIIDFGAAVKFIMHDGKHLESGGAAGTPLFMSTHSHVGSPPSRRDDLESLCYMVLWMMLGVLPWEDASSEEGLIRCKQDTRVEDLIAGQQLGPAGDAAADALNMVKALGVHEDPDYEAIKGLFASHAAGSRKSGKSKAKSKAKPKPKTSRAKAKPARAEPKGRGVVRVETSDEEEEEEEEDVVDIASPVPARKRVSAKAKAATTKAKRPSKSASTSASASVSDKPQSLVEIAMSKARAKSNKSTAAADASLGSASSSRASIRAPPVKAATATKTKAKKKPTGGRVSAKAVSRIDENSESEEDVTVVSDDDDDEGEEEMMIPLAVRLARRVAGGNKVMAPERNVVSVSLEEKEETEMNKVGNVKGVTKRTSATKRKETNTLLPSDVKQKSQRRQTKRRSGPAGRVTKGGSTSATASSAAAAAATTGDNDSDTGFDGAGAGADDDEESAVEEMSDADNVVGDDVGMEEGKGDEPRRSGRVRAQIVNFALQGMVIGGATVAMMQAFTTGQ